MTVENGAFNGEQARLPEFLECPQLLDSVPGSAGYVQEAALFVDEEGKCWLNGLAHRIDELEFGHNYVKFVHLDEGLVIDQFSNPLAPKNYRKSSFLDYEQRLNEIHTELHTDKIDQAELLPVIAVITSPSHALLLDKAFKQLTGQHYLAKAFRREMKSKRISNAVITAAKAKKTQVPQGGSPSSLIE